LDVLTSSLTPLILTYEVETWTWTKRDKCIKATTSRDKVLRNEKKDQNMK